MIIFYVGIILIIYSLIFKDKYSLNIAFSFIFLIMGFQSNVEGDYYSYFNEFSYLDLDGFISSKEEYFWFYLVGISNKFISFPTFICLLSLFQCFCVKKFIARFADKKYLFISAILFFFTFNYMLMQMKALRQGLAVDMCMLSYVLIDNRNRKSLFTAILLSLAAYFTHKSSVICIFTVWGYCFFLNHVDLHSTDKRVKAFLKPQVLVLALLLLYVSKKAFLDVYIIPAFSLLDDEHYMNYAIDFSEFAGQMNLLPIIYDCIIIILLSWYIKYASYKEKYLVYIAILGIFIDVLVFATGSIQRLLLYFIFTHLAIFPGIAKQLSIRYGKVITWMFLILLVGYAWKTSVFWLLSNKVDMFGQYNFIFMN